MNLLFACVTTLLAAGCATPSPVWKNVQDVGLNYDLDSKKRSIRFEQKDNTVQGKIYLGNQLLFKNELVSEMDYAQFLKELKKLMQEPPAQNILSCRQPFEVKVMGTSGTLDTRGCRDSMRSEQLSLVIKKAEYLILSH